ncbi:MAG: carboxypeptidase regulatory-like domain-containing protein [Planctomycetes bacterium]|nr:carboxypeptidase regulatory-like domain-containing protein [Planctomycetota bacterium]
MTDHPIDTSLDDLLDQRAWLADLARSLVRDPQAADDASQETWLQTLGRRLPLRDGRAWLATVLGNVLRQHHRSDVRRRRREAAVADRSAANAEVDPTGQANERFEAQQAVAAAVHALAEPFRSTILLHHFAGHSLAAIARTGHVPEGTVRWRLHRAHALLRERLQSTYGAERWRTCVGLLLALPTRSVAVVPFLLVALLLLGLGLWAPWTTASGIAPERRTTLVAGERPTLAPTPAVPNPASADTPRTGIAASLQPPLADPGVVAATATATVVAADGTPLPGATLRLTRLHAAATQPDLPRDAVPDGLLPRIAPPVQSGPDGTATLQMGLDDELQALLPEPARDLVAEAAFAIDAPGYAPEPAHARLRPGDTVRLGKIVLTAVSTVRGRVVLADGAPVPGAGVRLSRPPFQPFPDRMARQQGSGYGDPQATTAADGTFELANERIGFAMAWAALPGHTSAWALLDITAPTHDCGDLVLRPTADTPLPQFARTLRILVVDANGRPVADARVDHRWDGPAGQLMAGMTRTRPDGTAKVELLQPCHTAPTRIVVSALRDDDGTAHAWLDVPLRGDDDVRIELPATPPSTVRAVDAAGRPVPAFTAQWQAAAPAVGEATAIARRGVAVLASPAAPAELTVRAPGFVASTQPIGPGQTDVTVQLAPQTGITGIVTAGGRPVADAEVSLLHCDSPGMRNGFFSYGERHGRFDARTDAGGRFRIDHPEPATLRLLVRAPGFANHVVDAHHFEPARGWQGIAIELDSGGAIEGVVRDADGAPCPRTWVAINDFYGDARTMLTDAAGRYRFGSLRTGEYEVRTTDAGITEDDTTSITGPGMRAIRPAADCRVRSGETTTWDVLADRCRVEGRVLATGFHPRGWRVLLLRSHDGTSGVRRGRPAPVNADGTFAAQSSSSGPHLLVLEAVGGPLGNVLVEIPCTLEPGTTTLTVPLELAPVLGPALGASPSSWTSLEQRRADGVRIVTPVELDPAAQTFAAALAPVGACVLVQGTTSGPVDLGPILVAPR